MVLVILAAKKLQKTMENWENSDGGKRTFFKITFMYFPHNLSKL